MTIINELLLQGSGPTTNIEEIKLIFGLVIQTRQRSNSDGGIHGYRNLITNFLNGIYDYNNNNNTENNNNDSKLLFIQDLIQRYKLINPSPEHLYEMNNLLLEISLSSSSSLSSSDYYDSILRQSFGYILRTLQFIERGF